MKFRATWALAGVLPIFAGCHSLPVHMPWHHASVASCHKPQPYAKATSIPPLTIPEGMDSPGHNDALVVPALKGPVPPPPKASDPCLYAPPSFNVPQAPKA